MSEVEAAMMCGKVGDRDHRDAIVPPDVDVAPLEGSAHSPPAFERPALHADAALAFGRGLSSDEPDLWRKDLTGQIELWIEIGQPDEQPLRRACGRAKRVCVYTYSGNSKALAALARPGMQLQCFVQDGEVQILSGATTVAIELTVRK